MEQVEIAFIGLGLMGRPMAMHLLKKGHSLRVYNRTLAKSDGFEDAGATVCLTAREAAIGVKIVFLCVGDGQDVREVLFGSAGVAESASRGCLIVDHSTIAPEVAVEVGEACRAKGYRFLDAPISGGEVGAIDGQLAVMCGGDENDFEEAESIMDAYGKRISLVGKVGMGQVAKACNQVLVVANILGVAEAVTLAAGMGADVESVLDAVKGGAAESWSLNVLGPKMVSEDDSAGFYVKHQMKDLKIVMDAARDAGVPLPGTGLSHELYKAVLARGGEHLGNHTLYRALQVLGGKNWLGPNGED